MTAPAENVAPVIEARGLTKIFRDFWRRPRVVAVDRLDLQVRPGEVFGLLGPNGSGKSTTLKMILGLLHPSAGSLTVLGRSPRDVAAKARIGYMPEESYLYRYLTAEETLHFYGRLLALPARERRDRVEQLLTMTGLQAARRRAVGEFSKGMARRLALAQALLNDPDLLLLDEPTSGLDPVACLRVKSLLLALARRGKTIVASSHRLADMQDVCNRVAILHAGRVRAEGTVADLLRRPDACRITLPAPAPDALAALLARLRAETGAEPQVDHPAQSLEEFFVETVTSAPAQPGATAETGGLDEVAPFLSGSDAGTAAP
jgi:ABC-2 type transport system ATP-binding protein